MKNKKSGTICWDHVSHGYDAGYEDIVNVKGPHATPEQDKQFVMLLDKLAENGIIREYDAVTDKAHIFCPWQDEHSSDTSVSATSMWRNSTTGHAAIKCQHASHEDKKTKDFITAWIDEGIVSPQDFQDATYEEAKEEFGGDDEELDNVDTITLPTVSHKEMHTLSMKELKERFIYDRANDMYIDRRSGEILKAQVFAKDISRVKNLNVDPSSKAPYNKVDLNGIEAWHYTDTTVGEKPGIGISVVTWIPKEELRDCIIIDKHVKQYNSFNGLPLKPREGDTELFLKHIRLLFPDDTGFEWAMGFFAHMIQRPWEKPAVALLHVSPRKGLGRGLLSKMFFNMLGNMVLEAELDKLVDNKSDFNSFMDKKLLISIDEVKVPPRKRDQANEKLKSLVTESNILVNKKYKDEREGVPVFNRLFMMSNNLDAIKVDNDDRRMFVYAMPDDYEIASREHYDKVAKAIYDPRFLAAVMDTLLHWRIAVFKPFERPPTTAAKRAMTKATSGIVEGLALYAMEHYGSDNFCISKQRFEDIIMISAHITGQGHILHDKALPLEINHVFATWEFRINRKKYLDESPRVLYGKNARAVKQHSTSARLELGKRGIQKWDSEIKELLLENVV